MQHKKTVRSSNNPPQRTGWPGIMDAIILSGGKQRRMGGREKAFLDIGGKSLIERKVNLLSGIFSRVIVVTNNPAAYEYLPVTLVPDEKEGFGPLMGLCCGLEKSQSEYCFVTTCDTPFVQEALIKHLNAAAVGFDVAVPMWHGCYEPLCAVYSRRCIEHIRKTLETERKVILFYDKVNVNSIPMETVMQFDPEGISFFNINTDQDYEEALRIYKGFRDPKDTA